MEANSKEVEIARLFYEVNKILKEGMRRSLEEFGVTLPQIFVMSTLMEYGKMKITELSKKLNLSNSTVSGIVDRLEKQKLVIRIRSEEDRRIVYVKATPRFEAIHQGFHKKAEASFGDLLSAGSSAELEKVIEGLNVLKKILTDRN